MPRGLWTKSGYRQSNAILIGPLPSTTTKARRKHLSPWVARIALHSKKAFTRKGLTTYSNSAGKPCSSVQRCVDTITAASLVSGNPKPVVDGILSDSTINRQSDCVSSSIRQISRAHSIGSRRRFWLRLGLNERQARERPPLLPTW